MSLITVSHSLGQKGALCMNCGTISSTYSPIYKLQKDLNYSVLNTSISLSYFSSPIIKISLYLNLN